MGSAAGVQMGVIEGGGSTWRLVDDLLGVHGVDGTVGEMCEGALGGAG